LRLFSLRASNPPASAFHEIGQRPCAHFFHGVADFQAELAKANIHIPIIFMTGHGDIPMSVQAMKAGAIDFLSKPFRDQDMLGEQTRNGDVLILHRYALVWKILYQGIKQLFLLHNCRG
jgi:ActR/RegA family two-component response regulator